MDLADQKRELRREIRLRLSALDPNERREFSFAACELMRLQPIWREAQSILFYSPMAEEIDISPLLLEALEAGKTAALPAFVAGDNAYEAVVIRSFVDDCAPGKFGIHEPKAACQRLALNRLDLALAPGVGFDTTGHRLGRGRGFYDRLLAKTTAIKCGVAFDCQIVEHLPVQAHDIRMDCLLTPTRWRKLSP